MKVTKGTRRGGLPSPFPFNIVYHDMIDVLYKTPGGIRIFGINFLNMLSHQITVSFRHHLKAHLFRLAYPS